MELSSPQQEVFKYLIEFLTESRFRVVRAFLDAALSERSFLNQQEKIVKIADYVEESTDFSCIFEENHEYLANIVISVFDKLSYDKMHKLILSNVGNIITKSENSETYERFQNFFISKLKPEDLQNFVKQKAIFQITIQSKLDSDIFENLVNSIATKLGSNFVQEVFNLNYFSVRECTQNIFQFLILATKFNSSKVRILFTLLLKHLKKPENVIKIVKKCFSPHFDALEAAIRIDDYRIFKIMWIGIREFFESINRPEDFKTFILNRKTCIVESIAEFYFDGLQNTFWDLFPLTFTNPVESKDLIINGITKDPMEIYKFCQMTVNSTSFFDTYFESNQLKDILEMRDAENDANVLMITANYYRDINKFSAFWDILKKTFGAKFYELVNEIDVNKKNLIHYATSNQHCNIMSVVIEKLETDEDISRADIKSLLMQLDNKGKLFLWPSISFRKPTIQKIESQFDVIWTVIKNYFNPSEILELLRHCDLDGKNYLTYINTFNKTVFDILWEAILTFFEENNIAFKENILKRSEIDLKLNWIKTENMQAFDLSSNEFQNALGSRNLFENASDLKNLALCNNLDIHTISWNHLFNKFDDVKDLKDLVIQRSISGNNFIQNLLIHNSSYDIIKFTFELFQERFLTLFHDILKSTNINNENLLFIAICKKVDVGIQHLIWDVYTKCFKDDLDIFNVMKRNKGESNIMLFAASSNSENYKFILDKYQDKNFKVILQTLIMQNDIKNENIIHKAIQSMDIILVKIACKMLQDSCNTSKCSKNLKEFLTQQTDKKINILHMTVKNNQIEFHNALWDILMNNFKDDLESLKNLVIQRDLDGQNFINLLVINNTFEVTNLIFENKFKCFDSKQIRDIITSGKNCDLLHSAVKSRELKKYELVWKMYSNHFVTLQQRFELFKELDKDGKNLVIASAESNAAVFESMSQIFNDLYLNNNIEMLTELIEMSTHSGKNILHVCVQRGDILLIEMILDELDSIYNKILQSPSLLKCIVLKKFDGLYNKKCNILYCLKDCYKFENHDIVLNFVFNSVNNLEESKNLIMEINEHNDSYIQEIFKNYSSFTAKILELLKTKFTEKTELQKILNYEDEYSKKLIYHAITNINLNGLEKLLQILREIFNDEEYFRFFNKVDGKGNNIIHTALQNFLTYSSHKNEQQNIKDIFKLVIQKIREMPREETQKLLRASDDRNQNILEFAVKNCDTIEVHKIIWENINDYLERSEMLNLIQPIDKKTLLFSVISCNTIELADFTWEKIKAYLDTSHFKYLEETFQNVNISENFKNKDKKKWVTELLDKYKITYEIFIDEA